ncbi:MAG: carboxypeptidase-like regulatory domain-containing protein, partial [Planctomycetota bacterium]|nr:carboxypeptidase-like regulatory domain-containing protein [Planctomycetota bacterium]
DLEAALLVYSPGYAVTSIWPLNLEDGNESLEILLQQGEIVAGQLLNASGSPLPNMRIEVVLPEMKAPNNAEFPGGHPWREFGLGVTQSGPDGAFFLSDLPSGTHLLRAFQADGVQVGEIEVEAGDESVSWISP